MEKNKWKKIDSYSKRLRAINYLGEKCEECGESNYFKLTFHHKNEIDKEYKISEIKKHRWSKIEKEIKKCKLLCQNCHQEIHNDENGYKTKNKKIILEYVNIFECEKCGYNKCSGSLDFHHIEPDKKKERISKLLLDKGIYDIKNELEEELNKCVVLCKNCHMELHNNDGFFHENYEEILKKSQNIREIKPKLNREEIKKLYESGAKQIEISKKFGVSKGTISNIIKKIYSE